MPRPIPLFGLNETCAAVLIPLLMALASVMSVSPVTAFAASTVDTFSFESVELEARYRGLIAEIRCPKCQNVNIAGSDAPIAKDLRVTVHRLLGDGLSDAEILDFLQARYGDFVLYDPPVRANTLLLWLLPLCGFLIAGAVIFGLASRAPNDAVLSDEETARLDALLRDLAPDPADESADKI